MASWVVLALIVSGVFVSLIAHEGTHIVAATVLADPAITVQSLVPPRIKFDFADSVSIATIRLVALAPTLCGLTIHPLIYAADLPATVEFQLLLIWTVYAHASPADVRSALHL